MSPSAITVRYISLNLGPKVGANDSLVTVRVVPDGRDGRTVFARTMTSEEVETDKQVVFDPELGEYIAFRAGAITVTLRDIERHAESGPGGHAPVANTIWTWLYVSEPIEPEYQRFLLATARRLDGCIAVLDRLVESSKEIGEAFVKQRSAALQAIALAEVFVIAFARALDMILRLETVVGGPVASSSVVLHSVWNLSGYWRE